MFNQIQTGNLFWYSLSPVCVRVKWNHTKNNAQWAWQGVKTFGCFDILKVLMASEYGEWVCGSLQSVMPFLRQFDYQLLSVFSALSLLSWQ